jgi:hypothetical protein
LTQRITEPSDLPQQAIASISPLAWSRSGRMLLYDALLINGNEADEANAADD